MTKIKKKTIFKFLAYLIVGSYFSLSSNTPPLEIQNPNFKIQNKSKIVNPKIDSLKNLLKTTKHDTTKIKILHSLAWKLRRNNPKQALKYAKQALKLSDKTKKVNLKANAYNTIGEIYKFLANYPLALENHLNALNIREELNDSKGMADSYNNLGIIYMQQGEYPRALKYYFDALNIYEKIKLEHPDDRSNQKWLAGTYNNVGIIYYNRGEYKPALKYYFKALEIKEKLKDKASMANTYNNIAVVYYYQGKIERSLEFDMKSLTIRQEIGDKRGIAMSYTNIGETYTELAKADTTSDKQKKFEQALDYQHKALEIHKELKAKYDMTYSLSGIGNIYMAQGKTKASLPYFKQSAAIAEEIGAKAEMRNAYFGLYEAYKKLAVGSWQLAKKSEYYTKALGYHEKYDIVKDSVHNEEISKAIGKLEGIHEIDIKNIKRAYKQKEEERIAAEEKKRSDTQQHLGIASVLFLLFISMIFFTFHRLATLIPFAVVEIILFITFLLFFEYMLMLSDPIIEELSGGLPALKLAFTSIVAGIIFPFHRFFETKIRQRIIKAKKKLQE